MDLDEVLARFTTLPAEQQEKLAAEVIEATKARRFIPSPGPQTEAYFSKADVLLYGGAGGGGKEQSVNAKVLTPWGWKRIGDLRVGSRICAVDGTVTEVIGVYPQGIKDIYRVVMEDGGETTAGLDHLWLAWDMSKPRKIGNERICGEASARKYTTAQLIEEMSRDCGKGNGRRKRFAVPVNAPAALNVAGGCVGSGNFVGREIDPYFLGLVLGDGCVRGKKVEITTADEEIIDYVRDFAGDDVRVKEGRPGIFALSLRGEMLKSVKTSLVRMGIDARGSWEKGIPRQYLWGPVADRWAIFQGLMDTDGWAESKRAVYFTSVSRDLCEGVEHLARSLGGVVSWSEKEPTYTGSDGEKRTGRTAWCLRIKLTKPEMAFRLSRKREIASGIKHQFHGRIIESIDFSHREEAVCIQVAHPTSLYITDDFIVTHNTALVAGLALEEHRRSLIIRKHYSDLEKGGGLIDEVLKFYGSRDGFRGGTQALLRFDEGKVITFGGVNNPGDELKYQGQARDLLAIDEATQMAEMQVRFLMGWVRSEVEDQRTRAILATNPPMSSVGDWIIGMFRPWLDLTHSNPAEHGELRWFVTDPDGNDFEVDGPEPYQFPGEPEPVLPKSRTFISAKLSDNPFLNHNDDYRATQDGLPEPYRSAIRDGNFMAARKDADRQVIPTQWIREAQQRWTPEPPKHAPMSALAVDIAQGGPDNSVLVARYDGWFDRADVHPGRETPTGNEVAGLIISKRRNQCVIVVDMGGGYGGATKMRLEDNDIKVTGYKGANGTSRRTVDKQLAFTNIRSEAYWRMREALDPTQDGGSAIALPDDPEMVADLTAPTFEITSRGIKVMSKEKVCEKLGRSPDKGDAYVMANFAGPKIKTHGTLWRKYSDEHGGKRKSGVNVVMSRQNARRKTGGRSK